MNIDEAFARIKEKRPESVYISGKTSTGKSTFAHRLEAELGYKIVELDKVVRESIITALDLDKAGEVFDEVYKKRSRLDWIRILVNSTLQILRYHRANGSRVVIDGAIGNAVTLQEILAHSPSTEIIYLHPDEVETYCMYLTKRFMDTTESNHNGLPLAFWQQILDDDFEQFCKDRVITPSLKRGIEAYARASQVSSEIRLKELQRSFKNIQVVSI